jgi:hypothetical protein
MSPSNCKTFKSDMQNWLWKDDKVTLIRVFIGDHKASYFQAVKDSRRSDINVTELCMIKWLLHFKGSEDDSGNPTTFKAAFYEDFSLISTGHGKMNWQVAISFYA